VTERCLTGRRTPGQCIPRDRIEGGRTERGDHAHAEHRVGTPFGELCRLRSGAHDTEALVDDDEDVIAALPEERLEGGCFVRTGHTAGGANA
jgi:hypothetical protein